MPYVPKICVWEITLACNARCLHCGSCAGDARPDELSTAEALDAVRQLAALGCTSVTLSGGEPLVRGDWPQLAAAIVDAGMRLEMVSNGLPVAAQADAIAAAGFFAVSLSVDGPAEVHDRLRGVPRAFEKLVDGARGLTARGVRIGAVTQVNRHNLNHLDAVYDLLLEYGFEGWQLQLTLAHGLGSTDGMCLLPEQLPQLERQMLDYVGRGDLFVHAADSIGYMGRGENRIRSGTGQADRFWTGCQAGLQVVGLASDGTVRGCLSLATGHDEGNLRERTLAEIWGDPGNFSYNRGPDAGALRGACEGCALGKVCRAGCTSLAFAATGDTADNPYCLRRVCQAMQDGP